MGEPSYTICAEPPGGEAAPRALASPARLLIDRLLRTGPPRLGGHHRRVSRMSEALALRLGLRAEAAARIGRAGSLHDIGMALLPQDLLDSQAPLSGKQRALIQRHSAWGSELLRLAGDPGLKLAARVALEHHERWDGSGYPHGLAGERICLPARIVSICGVYDALRNPRPGKAALGHEAALDVLRRGQADARAAAFDPRVAAAFGCFHRLFGRIAEEGEGIALLSAAGPGGA